MTELTGILNTYHINTPGQVHVVPTASIERIKHRNLIECLYDKSVFDKVGDEALLGSFLGWQLEGETVESFVNKHILFQGVISDDYETKLPVKDEEGNPITYTILWSPSGIKFN
jgi:hypothetical protein